MSETPWTTMRDGGEQGSQGRQSSYNTILEMSMCCGNNRTRQKSVSCVWKSLNIVGVWEQCMQPRAGKVVSGRRQDLTGPWRGEQEDWGNSLSKGAGVFLGLIGVEGTPAWGNAPGEWFIRKHGGLWAMAYKAWLRTWVSQGGLTDDWPGERQADQVGWCCHVWW